MLTRKHCVNLAKALAVGVMAAVVAGCAAKSASENQMGPESAELRTISEIKAAKTDDGVQVSITADGELNYTAVKQRDPMGVALYFPFTRLSDTGKVSVADNDIVDSVKPGMSEDQKNAKVRINLLRDAAYQVEKQNNGIRVTFQKKKAHNSGPAPQAGSPPDKGAVEDRAASTGSAGGQKEAVKSSPSETADNTASEKKRKLQQSSSGAAGSKEVRSADKAGKARDPGPATVKQIDFTAGEEGKSALAVETERQVEYEITKQAPKVLQLRLHNTYLPDYHQHRPLITTRFDSAVDRIIPARSDAGRNLTEILIELREAVPYRPVQKAEELTIHFEPSEVDPRPLASADLPPWQQVLQAASEKKAKPSEGEQKKAEKAAEKAKDPYALLLDEGEKYTGQKIALDFYETNIKNVFRILQKVSGQNFAVDPGVTGSVTLSFQKPVPWDQVLDLVLQMNGLDKVEKGNIIRIARKETLQKEEKARQQRIAAIRKKQEQQKDLAPLVTEYIPVSYANAKNEVLPHVEDVLSKDRGSVTVDERNNQFIITDTKEKIRKAKDIISKIDKVTPQVIIEARIVEANDDFSRKVGVTWSAQSEDVYRSDLGGNYSYNSVINTPFIGGSTAEGGAESPSTFNFSFERLPSMGTPFLLDATLRAMETDQELKIISTPKIVTLDNKEATITQGIEWPYQNVEDEEVETEFKEIDLTLEVIPHITPDDRISLEINLQKDDIREITPSGEPALSTNEAKTELLIENGQTIVIGGIVKRTENNAEAGVPILKDIPGIGWLFSSSQKEVSKRELLIFMTPNIVQLEQRGVVQASTGEGDKS